MTAVGNLPEDVERRMRRRAFWYGFRYPFMSRKKGAEGARRIVREELLAYWEREDAKR